MDDELREMLDLDKAFFELVNSEESKLSYDELNISEFVKDEEF